MLYHLLFPLREYFIGFNLFQYITFRAAFAAISAFLLSLLVGKRLIPLLRSYRVMEDVSKTDSPTLEKLHSSKLETPTMGGLIVLIAVVGSTFLWGRLDNFYTILACLFTMALGIVGFADDYIKLTVKGAHGLSPRIKMGFLLFICLIAALALCWYARDAGRENHLKLYFPFFKNLAINLGWCGGITFVFLVVLVLVGSSNAVNLTDGLDGLAIGCVTMVSLAFAVVSYVVGRYDLSDYLNITYVFGAGELSVFCSAMIGAGMGFLWYNCFPAEIFMGDTGSLPLGGALGLVAVILRQELLLLIAGGIFVAEALSVILQVSYFKATRKRIFLCAPLHHHFQFKGWAETKVTVRFWIVAAICTLFCLATLKLR